MATDWQPPHMSNPNGPMVRFEVWPLYVPSWENRREGVIPISELGNSRSTGFVSDARFARPGDTVIKRANRAVTRKQRSSVIQSFLL